MDVVMNITIFVIILMITLSATVWANDQDSCRLPDSLQQQVISKYSGFKVINIDKLTKYHQKLFMKHFSIACPGTIKLDFFGSGKSTYAIALLKRFDAQSNILILIVAQQQKISNWDIIELEKTDKISVAPVIWTEPPGEYKGLKGLKTIKANYPVLFLVGYESWGLVYAWTGSKVEKIQISD